MIYLAIFSYAAISNCIVLFQLISLLSIPFLRYFNVIILFTKILIDNFSIEQLSQECARFPEILQNFSEFVEFVLGSFSCCNIEIAYSNFTFCAT